MNKKQLSETDIRSKFITPALTAAGWDLLTQIREEVAITSGRILVQGSKHKRGPAKFADDILSYKPNIPIAVIEAKDNKHTIGDGMQQALNYSELHAKLTHQRTTTCFLSDSLVDQATCDKVLQ